MTIICGIWSTGKDVDHRINLDSMLYSPAYPEADETAIWYNDDISFGQKTFYITPESLDEKLPFYQKDHNLSIIGDIRLDNRAELFAKLGISQHRQKNFGDARLILAAYQLWGEHCPDHLLGDFSFALWDGNKKKLFCCIDHFGNRGLFYFYNGKKFVFASTPNQILAAKNIPCAVNHNKLSTIIFPRASPLFGEESWFKDILPVPSATILTIDENGVSKRKYWVPEVKKELTFKNEAEYAEAFQELIFRSVSDRLRSRFPVTALLSGGLDSSAVVSVAAKILEKQNRELQVFSAVLPDKNDPVLKDERYFIEQFKTFPNVKINYITARGNGFFSDIDKLKTTVYGPNMISRHYLSKAFIEKAQKFGSRVILDGIGGEFGATAYGEGGYAELFWRFRWQYLWRELNARKARNGESLKYNLLSNVVAPFLPNQIMNFLKNRSSDIFQSDVHCIQDDFAAMLKERLVSQRKSIDNFSTGISPMHRKNQVKIILNRLNKARGGADFGDVEFRHPLMDIRLLEFCLSVPIDYKVKNGFKRYMVRGGLDKILPSEIQWRNSKGPFSPDYNRRYNAQLPQVNEFLESIQLNDPIRKIINVEELKSWIKIPVADDEFGTFAERNARDLVPQGIYLIQFLRRFPEFQN